MHFKSFVILAASLASLASAAAVGELVDTTVAIVDNVLGKPQVAGTTPDSSIEPTKEPVGSAGSMPLVQLPQNCTRKEATEIDDTLQWIYNLRDKQIAAIRKRLNDDNNELYIKQVPVRWQKPLEYKGERTSCKELQRLRELYYRMKSGKNEYIIQQSTPKFHGY